MTLLSVSPLLVSFVGKHNAIWPWGYISIFWHFCFSVCFCLKMHCEKETNVALTHIQVLWNPKNCRVRYLRDTLDKPWQTEHQPCCRLWNGSVSIDFTMIPAQLPISSWQVLIVLIFSAFSYDFAHRVNNVLAGKALRGRMALMACLNLKDTHSHDVIIHSLGERLSRQHCATKNFLGHRSNITDSQINW